MYYMYYRDFLCTDYHEEHCRENTVDENIGITYNRKYVCTIFGVSQSV